MKIFRLNHNKIVDNIFWGNVYAPSYCYVEITRRCNCKCQYCQVETSYDAPSIENNLFDKIINQLEQLKIFEIRLGGGEPLMDRELIDKIKIIKSKKMSVILCTNGMLISKEKAKELKGAGVDGVRISLDSTIPAMHDKVRGIKGCHTKTLEAIDNCKNAGLNVTISMTVGDHNYKQINKMKAFAHQKGVRISTHIVMPVGKGTEFLQNKKSFGLSKISKVIAESEGEKHCVAASQSIAIDINGNVSPCTFANPVSNIKEKTLKDILNSDEMKKFTKIVPDNRSCSKCEFSKTIKNDECIVSSICRGGCWALYEKN